jgi:antitoxin component YwqK of YwqJK toxin-antitoxin module
MHNYLFSKIIKTVVFSCFLVLLNPVFGQYLRFKGTNNVQFNGVNIDSAFVLGDTTFYLFRPSKEKVYTIATKRLQPDNIMCILAYDYWNFKPNGGFVRVRMNRKADEFDCCDSMRVRGDSILFYCSNSKNYWQIAIYTKTEKIGVQRFSRNKEGSLIMGTYESDNPFSKKNGMAIEWYPDGQVRIKTTFLNNKENGKRETFYANGQSQCNCHYKNDEKHGEQSVHWDNGQLYYKAIYEEGKLVNVLAYFNKNGQPLEIGSIKNGNGEWLQYDDNGQIEKIEIYENGKLKKTKKIKK